jgi:hypothetical protein
MFLQNDRFFHLIIILFHPTQRESVSVCCTMVRVDEKCRFQIFTVPVLQFVSAMGKNIVTHRIWQFTVMYMLLGRESRRLDEY